MLDKTLERGIGVVNQVALQMAQLAFHLHVFMHVTQLELGRSLLYQAQLGIGIVAAVPDPAAKIEVAAVHGVSRPWRRALGLLKRLDARRQLRTHLFVSIEREDPAADRLLQRRIFLPRKALPRFNKDFCSK